MRAWQASSLPLSDYQLALSVRKVNSLLAILRLFALLALQAGIKIKRERLLANHVYLEHSIPIKVNLNVSSVSQELSPHMQAMFLVLSAHQVACSLVMGRHLVQHVQLVGFRKALTLLCALHVRKVLSVMSQAHLVVLVVRLESIRILQVVQLVKNVSLEALWHRVEQLFAHFVLLAGLVL